ncbi:hypothetical protein CSUI_008028 [Cystoisospora suis]|uniref:Uncharacterized protein n=1 Tax=Cystoisospora suis TaxID=483139 RepID=A0A2C6KNT5_9APIC|nr:hypothetical protein CSUI_008028 [Cystoisospora suis]
MQQRNASSAGNTGISSEVRMEKAETRAAGVGKHSVIETGLGKRGREGVESSSRVRSRPLSGQQAAAKRKLVSRERNGALGDSQKISVFRPAVLFSPAGLPSEKDVARNKVEEDKKNICEDEEDITWSMKDSPSLRRLLVVRPEEKPEVGMGLFLVQPLLSCSCTIWEETKRRYSQQRPRTVASEKPRTSSGNQAGGSKRKETGGEENENGGDNCVDTRTELWTARSEEGCTDRSSEGSAGEGRKENMMEDRNLTTSTKSQIPPTLLTPNLATQIRARAGRTGFYQRIKTEGEPAQHRYKYRNSALQKQGKGGDGWRSPKQEPKQGANRVENETAPPAGSTAAKDKEGRPRYRCSADARMGHSRDITAEEREANEEQCTHAYQVKKRARTETQDQGFDRGHRPQESPVSDSSCPSCPRSENSPDYVNGTAPHKQRNGEVSAASPRDGELTVPTASAPTDSSGCWLDQSSSSRDTFSRCARSAEEKKHSETTDAKHIPVLACGCGGGNGGFRMLCFRGDVVLSAFNDCRLKNLSTISAAETDLIYCPDENPGIEPASHLSPAFTLESLNIPFSFQLQAHPYLSTGLSDDVKAVFGNHYCARHCHGFFDIHQSSAPCIVVERFHQARSEFSMAGGEPEATHAGIKGVTTYVPRDASATMKKPLGAQRGEDTNLAEEFLASCLL